MKKIFTTIGTILCATFCAFSFTACSAKGNGKLLGSPATATRLTSTERSDEGFLELIEKTDRFAARLSAAAYEREENRENLAVSPVSIFMALSLAAECAGGDTRAELLSALGVSYEQLSRNYAALYRALNVEYLSDATVSAVLNTTNSIWVNEGTPVNTSCIDALSDRYYVWSYSADFRNDNKNANLSVQNFIKEQTRGLIDQDFGLESETAFALINTLYLKEIWNSMGDDLIFTDETYDFIRQDGETQSICLLQSDYACGRAHTEENFSTFYAGTAHGYRLKFIVPNEGYGIDEVFTEETLLQVNAIDDYGGSDDENRITYYTRCLFPEFTASYDRDLKELLYEEFSLSDLFTPSVCDFSNLVGDENEVYCAKVQHVTKLEVKKGGIEGAAVTVAVGDSTACEEYRIVYEDFFVDRAFGYVLTDPNGVTLFSGVVRGL